MIPSSAPAEGVPGAGRQTGALVRRTLYVGAEVCYLFILYFGLEYPRMYGA